jgi:hypothetical protein
MLMAPPELAPRGRGQSPHLADAVQVVGNFQGISGFSNEGKER